MTIHARLIPAAFVAAVFLAACEKNGEAQLDAKAPVDTVVQPNQMPAPAPAAPPGPEARDSVTTRPLDDMTKPKENTSMPEAGHGNNHSSPALKKSSAFTPKARKVVWI